jgi:hypothetical protein
MRSGQRLGAGRTHHGTNSTLETLASSPTLCTEIRIRHARCSCSATPAFELLTVTTTQHPRLGSCFGFQTDIGNDANRRRPGLFDRIDERAVNAWRSRRRGCAGRGIQDPPDISVDVLPVDRREIDRFLTSDLEVQVALLGRGDEAEGHRQSHR